MKKNISLFWCSAAVVLALTALSGEAIAAVKAKGATPAPDESKICLHDGRGAKSGTMPDCEVPAGVDGGFVATIDGVKQFKASKRRVSDAQDVAWINENVEQRGLNDGGATNRVPKDYWGVRLNNLTFSTGPGANPYAVLPIVAEGKCRYIYNYSGKDLFVPLKNPGEWTAFLNNLPNGVTATTCAYPCPGTCNNANGSGLEAYFGVTSVRPTRGDFGLDAASQRNWYPVELPMAPTGAVWPTTNGDHNTHTFNYECTSHHPVADSSAGYCVEYETPPGSPEPRVCKTPGSRCVGQQMQWTEVWTIPVGTMVAGVVDLASGHTGWSNPSGVPSKRTGGRERPCRSMELFNEGEGKVCRDRIATYGEGGPGAGAGCF